MIGCSLLAGLLLQGLGSRVAETADAGTVALDETPPVGLSAYSLAPGK